MNLKHVTEPNSKKNVKQKDTKEENDTIVL